MKAAIIFFSIILGHSAAGLAAPPVEAGKSIFDTRCAACHSVNKRLTGPALAGVEDRREMSWIIDFVRSSRSLIKAGDEAALAVFEEYNKVPMPDHSDLSNEDIHNIMLYVKSATVEQAAGGAPFRMPGQPLRPSYVPLTIHSYGFFGLFFVSVGLLIAALLFLVKVKSAQRVFDLQKMPFLVSDEKPERVAEFQSDEFADRDRYPDGV